MIKMQFLLRRLKAGCMKIHPSVEGKLEAFINFAFFQSLYRFRFRRFTDNHRRKVRVHMTGTNVGQLHALLVGIIPAGLKALQRQYRNGKQKDKLFLMGCPQFVVSKNPLNSSGGGLYPPSNRVTL